MMKPRNSARPAESTTSYTSPKRQRGCSAVVCLCFLFLTASYSVAEQPGFAEAPSPNDELTILSALDTPVKVGFQDTPLQDAVTELRAATGVNFVFDRRALRKDGIDPQSPATLYVSGVSARSVLDILLSEHDLQWMVRYEVVWITTQPNIDLPKEARVFDISDVVAQKRDDRGHMHNDFDSLIELIITSIQVWWDEGED